MPNPDLNPVDGYADISLMESERVTRRRGLQVALACLGNVIPIAIASAAGWSSHRPVFFIGAAGACLVPLLVTGLPGSWRWARRIAAWSGLIPLTLMQAYTGGAASGYTVLMMMAMVWFGLQAATRDVLVMLALLCGCAFLPMLIVGPPAYPVQYDHAALLVLVGSAVAGSLRLTVRETTRLTDQLRLAASTDPLTGLLNRRGWDIMTAAVLAQAHRHPRPLAAAVIDLDGFKQLNDDHGHDTGDVVLRDVAGRLRSTFRAGDVIARSGGDEFIALLVDTDAVAALAAVRRLTATPSRCPMSAGVAQWHESESLPELLRRADLALYEAKRAGGACTALAPAPMAQENTVSPTGRHQPGGLRAS